VGQKKLVRKAEPPSKRGLAWPRWTGFRGMTLRSWLELLVVPLALVVIGFLFSVQQDARQQRIEDQRAEAERELAEQRAQDEALQAYLDQMSQLMLERKLLEAEQGDPVHTLAQARTSTAILRLDAEHNESVTRFLIDSGLAASSEATPRLLREITLSHAALGGAHLPNADLSDALLKRADLSDALLSGADLSGVVLDNADLSNTSLPNADLSDADLDYANLSDAYLPYAFLRKAFLFKADLSGANLSNADLFKAFLFKADLSDAFLRNADLDNAYLSDADLTGAEGITNEELDRQAASLEGATMPNGQKYEDWIKSKNREEGGKNVGSS
jgi:uncharacterized protein YjbI with pentapeptide repeats